MEEFFESEPRERGWRGYMDESNEDNDRQEDL